jgi:hypothetical protein
MVEKQEYFLALLDIEPRFLGRPARSMLLNRLIYALK